MATATTTADTGKLNYKDLLKGALMVAITAILTAAYSAIESGGFETINWKAVLTTGAIAGVGYLVKNLFTPPSIVVENPPQQLLNAAKEGNVVVKERQ
jgi:hypothetical protein